ncbi:TNF receptor-associated factor 5 [Euwallacea similis]|uniref:TNF receptor-associated factor 5 n=1 Tax=Euwallacea similis TaxID=1736056 RepID=UPI00344E0609
MSNNIRPFTCYFCAKLIENESEMGHTSLCSKVLVPCPYKCGSYISRDSMIKHKAECTNNVRKSASLDLAHSYGSLPLNATSTMSKSDKQQKHQEEIGKLQKQLADLELRMEASRHGNFRLVESDPIHPREVYVNFIEVKDAVNKHSQTIQKFNYINGYLMEWKKKVDAQLTSLNNSLSSINSIKHDSAKLTTIIQEKLLQVQNLQMDFNLTKQNFYKENSRSRNVEIDFARNLEDIRTTFNKQNESFENMWLEQTGVLQNAVQEIQTIKSSLDEQKAKYAGLVFDIRAVSQISSEAAEKIEIMERNFSTIKQEINQMKINIEILEDLSATDSATYQRLVWRITDVESKLKRAKENDIVLKSPIFYTTQYGYKMRVLLYINGLYKWKDRHALACFHILKGEYDALLTWPCAIEGHITLRDLSNNNSQKKDFSKYIKTKRDEGDKEEDEPQESSSTYIFIPHSTLFKENYIKDDTFFLDISIRNDKSKYETSL